MTQKMMILLSIALFASHSAFAASDAPSASAPNLTTHAARTDLPNDFQPNIKSGNLAVGGSFGSGYSTYSNVTFYLNPTLEYFVIDRLSLGGSIYYSNSSTYKSYGLGPSFSYYFWQQERWAAFFGGGAVYHDTFDGSYYSGYYNYWTAQAKLGLNYFVYPTVAFGPFLSYGHTFSNQNSDISVSDSNYGQLLFQFSVFL